MRKSAFCIPVFENKDTVKLHSYGAADQRLPFHYKDSTIPLLSKSKNEPRSEKTGLRGF